MKLFATDLDGTLLNSNHEISKENVEAIALAQKNGIEIVIATGRTYSDALYICEKSGIKSHIISNNGALVFSKDGNKLKSSAIDRETFEYVTNWFYENQYFFEVCTDKHLYLPLNSKELLEKDFELAKKNNPSLSKGILDEMISLVFSQEGIEFINSKEELLNLNLDFCSMTGVSFDKEKLQFGRNHYSKHDSLSMVVSTEYNFEMLNKYASKGNSLEYLANHLNISLKDVAAIGDNYNDISMFKKAGISVAMGNAAEDIKKMCTHVSLTNNYHGVAHIINKLIDKLKLKTTPA